MSNIAKISVEDLENETQVLYDLDKSKSLCDIVKDVCELLNKPQSSSYGLKLKTFKDNTTKIHPYYITQDNLRLVQHSDCLKLSYSAGYYVDEIFKSVDRIPEVQDMFFDKILDLSTDPEFIHELDRSNRIDDLLEIFIREKVEFAHNSALILTILHLLKRDLIRKTEPNFLEKVFAILKSDKPTLDVIEYNLSLMHQILMNKSDVLNIWKEQIFKTVSITLLMPYIRQTRSTNVQGHALTLINMLIRCSKGAQRLNLIKEVNQRGNKNAIYDYIIKSGKELEKSFQHELYVCQTYLLSLFADAANTPINIEDNMYFQRNDFELDEEDTVRRTLLLDFEDPNGGLHPAISIESILYPPKTDKRYSLASVDSSSSSSLCSMYNKRSYSESEAHVNTISLLTWEVLKFFKNNHWKDFRQSQIEEHVYQPGIFATSEHVVQMLVKILRIGAQPGKTNTFYQPTVFLSSKRPFFHEFFSRTMCLLSKTRREMKVSTIGDYEKVIRVLEKQIAIVLEQRPMDFNKMTMEMTKVSFRMVQQCWQKDEEQRWKLMISQNAAVQKLKKRFVEENEEYVMRQRMTVLVKGNVFPKVLEKKMHGSIFVRVSENHQMFFVSDYDEKRNEVIENTTKTYNIEDITHISSGKNCDHWEMSSNPNLAFAIIVNYSEKIKFIARNKKTAAYWLDGFNMLKRFEGRSEYFEEELKTMVDLDVELKLLNLQTIQLPDKPPKVPRYPKDCKLEIAPKPKITQKH